MALDDTKMALDEALELLHSAAEIVANECFTPEHVANSNLEDRKIKGLGILLAHYTEWAGNDILQIAIAALEDANLHSEAGKLQDMLDDILAQ